MDPRLDIMRQAACARQRKYWEDRLPTMTDDQVVMIMDTLVATVNLITTMDMSDGVRNGVNFRSKLGTEIRMVLEMLMAPKEETPPLG